MTSAVGVQCTYALFTFPTGEDTFYLQAESSFKRLLVSDQNFRSYRLFGKVLKIYFPASASYLVSRYTHLSVSFKKKKKNPKQQQNSSSHEK